MTLLIEQEVKFEVMPTSCMSLLGLYVLLGWGADPGPDPGRGPCGSSRGRGHR